MKLRRRGPALALLAILVAGGALAISAGPEIVFRLRNQREWCRLEGALVSSTDPRDVEWRPTIGWIARSRETDEPVPIGVFWYVETGFIHSENHGPGEGTTVWRPDGTIAYQWIDADSGVLWTFRDPRTYGPPWQWGAADQDGPSAPWLGSGLTADRWFWQGPGR